MANLALAVLGGFRARVGSGPPLALPKKTQALVTFLALQPGREHTREKLTSLLWAGADDLHARHSLRQALFGLRRALGRARHALVEADVVTLDTAGVEVDALTFERLVGKGTRPALAEATRLYAGDLLEGVSVGEGAFAEWLLVERERLREMGINAFARLLEQQTQTASIDAALPTALRLLALDPLQERAHRALMQLYDRQGRRASALRQYQVCVELLRRELGVEPDEETRELYQKILRQPPALPTTPRARTAARRGTPRAPAPGRSSLTPTHDTPLVGRAPEAARLGDALERAARGHGHVALLVGEAGIGKSRLVEHLALDAHREGHRVLVTRCHETEQVLPFRPWVDALREGQLVGEVERLGASGPLWRIELSRILPELGSPGLFPSGTREDDVRIFEAVTALVRHAASERPLVLVVEDLQWADDMTVRLFSFLGRRIRTAAVLLVGTVRDEDMSETAVLRTALAEFEREPHASRLTLGPLSHTDTGTLVAALTPTGSPDASIEELARRVWVVSEGNPFVIVETMRALQERGALADDGTLALAPRVREVLVARLARLGQAARHVCTVAAVIGEASTFPLLAEASGLGHADTARAVEELVRRRVLAAVGERFRFTHDRVREFAYERLLASARLALHATVAQALERQEAGRLEEIYDRLAHHYTKGDDPPRAITYLVLFADKARQRYALDDAARSLDQALTLVERLPPDERERRRIEVVVRKAGVLTTLARFRQVLDLLLPLRERVEALDNLALAGPYYRLLALTHSYLGDQAEARRAAERAIHAAQHCGDDLTAGQAFYVLTIGSYWQAEPLKGIEHGRRAVTHLARTPNRDALGTAYWMLGLNHFLLGDFDRALEAEAEAEAIGNAIGDARVQAYVAYANGWILGTRGEFDAALEVCRYSLAASRDPFAETLGRTVMGYVCLEKGDAAEALSLLEQVVKRFREFGVRQSAGRVMAYLSEAYLRVNHRASARDTAEQALAFTRELGDRWGTAWAVRVLGRAAALDDDAREAASRLEESLRIFAEIPAAFEVARTRVHLAELALARGDGAAAATHVEEARHIFLELQLPKYAERAERLAGEIGAPPPRQRAGTRTRSATG